MSTLGLVVVVPVAPRGAVPWTVAIPVATTGGVAGPTTAVGGTGVAAGCCDTCVLVEAGGTGVDVGAGGTGVAVGAGGSGVAVGVLGVWPDVTRSGAYC